MENRKLVSFGKHAYSELIEPGHYRIHFNRVAFTLEKDELSSMNRLFEKVAVVQRENIVPVNNVIAWNGIGEVQRSNHGIYLLRIYNCTLYLCEKMLRCFRQLCAFTERNGEPAEAPETHGSEKDETDINKMLDTIAKEVFRDDNNE